MKKFISLLLTLSTLMSALLLAIPAGAEDTYYPELTGVDMDDPRFRVKYCIDPNDVSHLNDEGMNYVLPKMEKFIAEAYVSYLNYLYPPETTVPETTAPETTAETTTEISTAAPETEPANTDSGCGGFISFGGFAALICGACLVIGKKEK